MNLSHIYITLSSMHPHSPTKDRIYNRSLWESYKGKALEFASFPSHRHVPPSATCQDETLHIDGCLHAGRSGFVRLRLHGKGPTTHTAWDCKVTLDLAEIQKDLLDAVTSRGVYPKGAVVKSIILVHSFSLFPSIECSVMFPCCRP